MPVFYQNAQIFDGSRLLTGYSLSVSDHRSIDLVLDADVPDDAVVKVLPGGILTPGYVELQANGGGGVLFNDQPSVEGIKTILAAHRRFGTVAMLPTFITDRVTQLDKAIKAVREAISIGCKGLIGGHFEGPFINLEKKGTHQIKYIRSPDASDYKRFVMTGLGNSLVTLAPECVSDAFIKHLSAQGFCINAGHTMANKSDMIKAHKLGLVGVTHLYNAMPPLQGRQPSVIGSAAALGLFSSIIVDGIHSDTFSLQTAFKLFGKKRLMLVTDSMHIIGASDIKSFDLTGQKVFVKKDRLVNETGNLAGAHITMEQSVKNAILLMKSSIEAALHMAITTPATYIKRPDLANVVNRDVTDILYLDEHTLDIQSSPFNNNDSSFYELEKK